MMLRALLAFALCDVARATFFDNLSPRRDSTGSIMDSHDFSLRRIPADPYYYMTSIAYGLCKEPANYGCDQTADKCGFQPNHTINVWKSLDLSSGSWEFVTTAIAEKQRVDGTIFRPDGIWNPNTQTWVVWYNAPNYAGESGTSACSAALALLTYLLTRASPLFSHSPVGYSAYTAPSPAGPYTLARAAVNVTIVNSTQHCGDFHLFVDPADNTPYVIAGCNFHMWIERLLPNMLDSAGDTGPTGRFLFDEYFIEAPALFYRPLNGKPMYYAVFGHCCCYCYQGSGAIVHTAPHPLGPWTTLGDVACIPDAAKTTAGDEFLAAIGVSALPTPGQGCQYVDPKTTSALRAQQSFIAEVDTPTGPAFLWAGDRWQQSWDGLKGHDPQTWVPLVFDETTGAIAPLRWLDNFTVDIVSGQK